MKIEGDGYLQEQYISVSDLRKVSGIGDKTIERIKEQLLQNELDDNYKSEYNPNIKLDINNIYQGDCLELMNGIPDKSVDMILCDLPYGTTACKWDTIISFDRLWSQYERIIKNNGVVVLTGREPFSSHLRLSNDTLYRYDWIWEKTRPQRFVQAKKMPLSYFENISVFYKSLPTYNPQMTKGKPYVKRHVNTTKGVVQGEDKRNGTKTINGGERYPSDIIKVSNPNSNSLHPTQKPVALFEYLIKTYTNEGDLVLDNCIGSGTTAISAINTNRNYIGIELDEDYCEIAKNRINKHKSSILLK